MIVDWIAVYAFALVAYLPVLTCFLSSPSPFDETSSTTWFRVTRSESTHLSDLFLFFLFTVCSAPIFIGMYLFAHHDDYLTTSVYVLYFIRALFFLMWVLAFFRYAFANTCVVFAIGAALCGVDLLLLGFMSLTAINAETHRVSLTTAVLLAFVTCASNGLCFIVVNSLVHWSWRRGSFFASMSVVTEPIDDNVVEEDTSYLVDPYKIELPIQSHPPPVVQQFTQEYLYPAPQSRNIRHSTSSSILQAPLPTDNNTITQWQVRNEYQRYNTNNRY